MITLETVVWLAGLAAVMTVLLMIAWWLWPVRSTRMVRCPDTGAVAVVTVESGRRNAARAPEPGVRHCDLWPLRKPCARRCVHPYRENRAGERVSIETLRPFEHP